MSFCILKQWRLAYPNSGKGVSSSHCLSSRFHMPTPRRSRSPGPYLSQKYSQRYKEFHPLDIISELISQYLIIFNICLQCDSLRMCRNFSCSGCDNFKAARLPGRLFYLNPAMRIFSEFTRTRRPDRQHRLFPGGKSRDYQLAFFTPGIRPAEAISRNWIRLMPN